MSTPLAAQVAAHTARPVARRPATLQGQAEARAHHELAGRLAEIQALAPMLATLDAFRPLFSELGLVLYPDNLRVHHGHVGKARRTKVMRMHTRGVCDSTGPARWLRALLAAGFSEVSRTDGDWGLVELTHGTMRLIVDAPRKPLDGDMFRRSADAAAVAVHAHGVPA